MPLGRAGVKRTLLWLALTAALALVALSRLELTFDLSAFLPSRSTLSHDILVEQVRNGPASRLMVIGISGAPEPELEEASDRLRIALSGQDAFVSVLNGRLDSESEEIPAPVDRYYLLMRDVDYSERSLAAALQSRLRDLALGGGAALRGLIARDPFLVTADILSSLSPVEMTDDPWFAEDGSAVLIAETRAAAIDIQAQQTAVDLVRREFEKLPGSAGLELDMTGVGAFSVELQDTIRAEATRRSVLASLALVVVLLVFFRRPVLVLLAALPLGIGFVAGLAAVSLVFEEVHGITLAFGFTMLGIAIDYPLHLFSHARHSDGTSAITRIWPTMRLGAISTVIAYLALVFAGSEGLSQLGVFTTAGVLVALAGTRTWLPYLLTARAAPESMVSSAHTPVLRPGFAVAAFLAAIVVMALSATDGFWDDELSSLSPVPAERLSADQMLRSATVTPDLRYQLVLTNESLEALLLECEAAEPLLAAAAGEGLLSSWQSVCQVLPSRRSQTARQSAIPATQELRRRVADAIAGTPFRADALDPFIAAAGDAKALETLLPADFRSTRLRPWLDSHLLELDSARVALISLTDPDPSRLAPQVAEWDVPAQLVDLQTATAELMRDYRSGAIRVVGMAAVAILLLLWFFRGRARLVVWIGLTVSSALALTVAVTNFVHGGLTVVHLVGLLLVLGLGLDYALFLSRAEASQEQAWSRKGVMACAASTTLAFAILAGSSIPVLGYLGYTVALGSAASFVLALAGTSGRSAAGS
jgi:predicted exporter